MAMAPYKWGVAQLLLLSMPITSAAAICIFIMPSLLIYACARRNCDLGRAMADASAFMRMDKIAAALVLLSFLLESRHWEVLEEYGFATMPPSLPRAHVILLLSARYFSFRWTCNVGLYFAAGQNKRAIELIDRRAKSQCELSACLRLAPDLLCYVLALTGAAHLFVLDAVLGLSIQLPFFIVGLIPGTRRGHYAILGFSKKVREVAEQQRVDLRFSTAGSMKWLSLKIVMEKERAANDATRAASEPGTARAPEASMRATVQAARAADAAARAAQIAAADTAPAGEPAVQAVEEEPPAFIEEEPFAAVEAERSAVIEEEPSAITEAETSAAEDSARAPTATGATPVVAHGSARRTADEPDYFI
jgi:hypothetical protein